MRYIVFQIDQRTSQANRTSPRLHENLCSPKKVLSSVFSISLECLAGFVRHYHCIWVQLENGGNNLQKDMMPHLNLAEECVEVN